MCTSVSESVCEKCVRELTRYRRCLYTKRPCKVIEDLLRKDGCGIYYNKTQRQENPPQEAITTRRNITSELETVYYTYEDKKQIIEEPLRRFSKAFMCEYPTLKR